MSNFKNDHPKLTKTFAVAAAVGIIGGTATVGTLAGTALLGSAAFMLIADPAVIGGAFLALKTYRKILS